MVSPGVVPVQGSSHPDAYIEIGNIYLVLIIRHSALDIFHVSQLNLKIP